MTKLPLEIVISNLKDACIAGEMVLEKLEKAQKDLESPPHKWVHGDVFLNEFEVTMIYIWTKERSYVFCISGSCGCFHKPENFLKNGKFLFNIKERL